MRKILYVSGTRADFGPARKVLKTLNDDPNIDLEIWSLGCISTLFMVKPGRK